MRRNFTGCAICDSTWGDTWAEVEGERTFFCCAICATQFRHLVDRIRSSTGWPTIDAIEIAGDRRGRRCTAAHGGERFGCFVAFDPEGNVREFRPDGPPTA